MASAKGPQAYRSISEAAAEVGVAAHVLRFWEQRFSFIRPMTRAGGRRFYRPEDIRLLRGVRALLHDQGRSLKDVQRLHREEGLGRLLAAGDAGPGEARPAACGPAARAALAGVLADLERARAVIDRLLAPAPQS